MRPPVALVIRDKQQIGKPLSMRVAAFGHNRLLTHITSRNIAVDNRPRLCPFQSLPYTIRRRPLSIFSASPFGLRLKSTTSVTCRREWISRPTSEFRVSCTSHHPEY